MRHYDVIIVGAGPAGIFSALELLSGNKALKIIMLEKGKDIDKRICPAQGGRPPAEHVLTAVFCAAGAEPVHSATESLIYQKISAAIFQGMSVKLFYRI